MSTTTVKPEGLPPAVEFFWDHAPYSWNASNGESEQLGRDRGAQELAMAEQTAKERGWWVVLGDDQNADEPGDQTLILYADGYEYGMTEPWVLAAIGGVDAEPTDEWRRVLAAQLALEAFEDERVNDARVEGSA